MKAVGNQVSTQVRVRIRDQIQKMKEEREVL